MGETFEGVTPPEIRIRFYREQAAAARRNADAAAGLVAQAFRMEAAQWDRAALRLERTLLKDARTR